LAKKRLIKISREKGDGTKVPSARWKELIASLVLSGFNVYGGEEEIHFELGNDDGIIETEAIDDTQQK
jgi:hypothetical protein